MKSYERKQLLERINRDGATVGVDIPDRIELQGELFNLRDFVFEIKRRDTIPSGEEARVEQAKRNLRRERVERVQKIETGNIDKPTGEELVDTIVGIDRALTALNDLSETNIEAAAEKHKQADTQRWMSFLQKALGSADKTQRRG